MKIVNTVVLLIAIFSVQWVSAQENYKTKSEETNAKIYSGGEFYHVPTIKEPRKYKKPKNVIVLIGDGMGITQVFSGLVANGGNLYLNNFKKVGFTTTHSTSNFITDSAAGGTALASGQKTYNGAIGVDTDTIKIVNIREKLEKKGLATGVVSTSAITHATPAAYVAHQKARGMYEEIAADFLKTDIDLFIGGGLSFFNERKDGKDLIAELKAKNYQVAKTMDEVMAIQSGKIAALLAPQHIQNMIDGRGKMLPMATKKSLELLSQDKDGFFVMIEGSQIDWGGHQNNTAYIVTEMLDFDQAVGEALKFAAKDRETLVIVTSDHETGGMTVEGGSYDTGSVTADYTTGSHSAVMVPVFAFGPGSENFGGIYDNTDIPKKIMQLLEK